MTLDKIDSDKTYLISEIHDNGFSDQNQILRLKYLGFIKGKKIKLLKVAPLSKDPLLFHVNGSLIALTKKEAELIKVTET
jgi:Fe2+ transport system protein FeoA